MNIAAMQEQVRNNRQKSTEWESVYKALPVRQQPRRRTSRADMRRLDPLFPVIFEHSEHMLDAHPSQKSTNSEEDQSWLITINISGSRFQTYLSTLQIYPHTLLGDENKRKQYWNANTQEYFFDRHRTCFESILYYYQSQGRLRRPNFVSLDTFLEEISFFQLGPEALAQVHRTENVGIVTQFPMLNLLWQQFPYCHLEYPQHSHLTRAISLLSMFFTILSCISLVIETLPAYNHDWKDICKKNFDRPLNSTDTPYCSALFRSPFFIIQTICVTYFLIEFLLRLISTSSYFRFILSIFNWIDLAAIVPYFVILEIQLFDHQVNLYVNAVMGILLLRLLRFARIFKLYVVFRRLKSLRVLSSTIKEALMDFTVIIAILTFIAFLFGALAYFAEQETNGDTFDSIPKATYWGIITITGVGYGDMYPITPVSRILTCLCAFIVAGMMGMLVPVLLDRYQCMYNRKIYVSQHEIPPVESKPFQSMANEDREAKESSQKTSQRQQLSSIVSHHRSIVQKQFESDQHRSSAQDYKVQFLASFDGENIDSHTAETIARIRKGKMTEAIPDTSAKIRLQLMEEKNNRLWTTYNSDTTQDPPSHNQATIVDQTTEALDSQFF